MTRKDYEAVAEVFKRTRRYNDIREKGMWSLLLLNIADVFAADNERFDRKKFYKACEG